MLDNQLIQLFRPILLNGLSDLGFPDVVVKQAYQPTQQGAESGPTLYFFKTSDKRYGFLKRDDVWDTVAQVMRHTELQQYETTFQIEALSIQDPTNLNSVTASDLVNMAAQIIQSDVAILTLAAQRVGILRVTDIRNPYFMDDKDRFEATPSFDFTLLHEQSRVTIDPVIQSVEFDIFSV